MEKRGEQTMTLSNKCIGGDTQSMSVRHTKMWLVLSKEVVDDLENPENQVHK